MERKMPVDGGMMIAAMEAQHACKGEPDLMERIKKAMRACIDHWMETNEANQFRAAVAAVILESDGAEKERVERSAAALNRLGAMLQAMQAGVAVDLETELAEQPKAEDLIPLRSIWEEIKKTR
jgi:hypothetical protein